MIFNAYITIKLDGRQVAGLPRKSVAFPNMLARMRPLSFSALRGFQNRGGALAKFGICNVSDLPQL